MEAIREYGRDTAANGASIDNDGCRLTIIVAFGLVEGRAKVRVADNADVNERGRRGMLLCALRSIRHNCRVRLLANILRHVIHVLYNRNAVT